MGSPNPIGFERCHGEKRSDILQGLSRIEVAKNRCYVKFFTNDVTFFTYDVIFFT